MGSAAASEETLQEVLQRYEKAGFLGQFGARPASQIICFSCHKQSAASGVKLLAMHRLEGASDPGEELAVAAIECPTCHTRGTMSLAFGIGSSPEDAGVVKALMDRRSDGPVAPGL